MGESSSITTITDGPTGRLPDLRHARSSHGVVALRERRLDRLVGTVDHRANRREISVSVRSVAVIVQPDRLEISRIAQLRAGPIVVAAESTESCPEPCSASTERKYAVAPIAAVNDRPQDPAPPAQLVVHLDSVMQVTNLGSLIDVLA